MKSAIECEYGQSGLEDMRIMGFTNEDQNNMDITGLRKKVLTIATDIIKMLYMP